MAKGFPMPTVMGSGHQFSRVPQATIERSTFDRSHGYKTTFFNGFLIPVYVDEVLPGDTFHLRMSALCRLTSQLKPIMDNLYLESFFFFVPYRLIWANFQKFMGEQTNPGDSTSFLVPVIQQPFTPGSGSLVDFFGIPCFRAGVAITYTGNNTNISALPFRAYNLIYNQWFRDENMINSVTVPTTDGPDALSTYNGPYRRGKRHDYFTSCLPFLQKGVAQTVPLAGLATVKTQASAVFTGAQVGVDFLTAAGGTPASNQVVINTGHLNVNATAGGGTTAIYPSNLAADLATATAAFTINALRQAFQIQKLLERDARGGTRYTEIIRSHFGVTSPDARLQRPEYLGGGSTPILISPVVQTTAGAVAGVGAFPAGGVQANLGGMGTGVIQNHGFTKSFTEHGVLMGIVEVRADLTYQQGVDKMWQRQTRYDFFWPALAHIGEQSVLNSEIFVQSSAADNTVFGYQERYAEYRYKPSRITGKFNSDQATPLDIWHLSQKFTAVPTLNQSFIEDNAPISTRTASVNSEPEFYFDAFFSLRCARPMPVFGVPGLIDHF